MMEGGDRGSHSTWNSLNNETITRMELCTNATNYYKKKRVCKIQTSLYVCEINPITCSSEQLNEEKLWYQDFPCPRI